MRSLFSTLRFLWTAPLNRGRRGAALGRWLRWQLASRTARGPLTVPFGPSTRLEAASGRAGVTGNIYAGLHEFEDMAFVLHLLRPGDLFIDVGANAGSYTVLAAGETGCRAAAFEPAPDAYECLLRNIRLNRLEDRVTARRLCVGAEAGRVRISTGEDCTNHVATAAEPGGAVEVAVARLDALVAIDAPTLIKIDVEGYESAVIEGAAAALRRADVLGVIMELNGSGRRYGFDEAALHARMRAHGFGAYSYEPFTRTLTPLLSANSRASNTLYLKDDARVRLRLAEARRFTINGATF
jgi:FkbM family methyltransferase